MPALTQTPTQTLSWSQTTHARVPGALALLLALVFALLILPACATRSLEVTSDPPGATVFANDVELGRTPLTASFRYYGTYDMLILKDGFEPLRTSAKAKARWFDYPPGDVIASPTEPHRTVRWHFSLTPAAESVQGRAQVESQMLQRAADLRARTAQ
jgi:hypothetical protein